MSGRPPAGLRDGALGLGDRRVRAAVVDEDGPVGLRLPGQRPRPERSAQRGRMTPASLKAGKMTWITRGR